MVAGAGWDLDGPLAFASLINLAMWSWRHAVRNETLLGDSWSLCAWTICHAIRHHVSKMEGL